MLWTQGQRSEDKQIKRTLWQIEARFGHPVNPLSLLHEECTSFLVEGQGGNGESRPSDISWISIPALLISVLTSLSRVRSPGFSEQSRTSEVRLSSEGSYGNPVVWSDNVVLPIEWKVDLHNDHMSDHTCLIWMLGLMTARLSDM